MRYTEAWGAERFTEKYGDSIKFDHTTKRWLIWNEEQEKWEWDITLKIQHLITKLCRCIAAEAARDPNLNGAQRSQIATRFGSYRVISGVQLLLKIDRTHACAIKEHPHTRISILPTEPPSRHKA